ncbi:tyrosine-type recombinase/integrase [Metabacillus sp. Hm71]|uniref:tyrosine-type recombinase/integrase n=1 Tax=Metabacillus sp. Hm71 TaxID=3450743 RepID=UPI003F42128A
MSSRRNNRLNAREIDIAVEPVEFNTLSFDGAMSLFIADARRKSLREATITYYQREINHFRNWLAQHDKLELISKVVRADIDSYVDYLKDNGKQNGTINTRLRAIRAFFGYLYESKYIKENPMRKYSLLKERKGNIETFTMQQLRQLLNAPDKRTFTGLRDYTYMLLLLETGIRLSEATGILVEDVKLSEGTIFIRETKNHFHRYVPIQAKMKEQLRRYIKIRGTCETEHLFVTIDGTKMQRGALQKLVGKYGKQAKIKGVRCSPHTLRHTFAKMSVMNGAGVFELQKILGHSTMEMVKVYVNLYASDVYDRHKEFSPLNNL